MGLMERIVGNERAITPNIGVHQFSAVIGEWERGRATRAQVITTLGLRPEDEVDLDALIAVVQSMGPQERFKFRTEIHDVLMLAEDRHLQIYETVAEVRARLGI